jgi:hypothetical protein
MSRQKRSAISEVSVSPVYLSARSAIIAPERSISVTTYSLEKWLPRLGADRWSLVQLLRGLCIDAPRRTAGTKRITVSWRFLAECLQVHEETIASWLKHEVISDDKPWRRIMPVDDYAEYLSLFIPRLRYAYETKNGKTRRVGFLLEVLMEDPVAPEDEIKLAQQVELLQMQQGELGLDTYRSRPDVNLSQTMLPDLSNSSINPVNVSDLGSPSDSDPTKKRLTPSPVNPKSSDLLPTVKQHNIDSLVDVRSTKSDLHPSKSDLTLHNVNKLKILINQLNHLKHRKRNYQQILEPLITFTESLLEDYHSTAMLYKVSKVLFPDRMDIYVSAVEQALLISTTDASSNKGAIFVKTLRELADQAGIDLGFKKPINARDELTIQHDIDSTPKPSFLEAPIEQVIWSETLSVLQGQMTKAMFNSVMQGTQLSGVENGTYIIQVPTNLAKDWLDNRLRTIVVRALSSVIGSSVEVAFRVQC